MASPLVQGLLAGVRGLGQQADLQLEQEREKEFREFLAKIAEESNVAAHERTLERDEAQHGRNLELGEIGHGQAKELAGIRHGQAKSLLDYQNANTWSQITDEQGNVFQINPASGETRPVMTAENLSPDEQIAADMEGRTTGTQLRTMPKTSKLDPQLKAQVEFLSDRAEQLLDMAKEEATFGDKARAEEYRQQAVEASNMARQMLGLSGQRPGERSIGDLGSRQIGQQTQERDYTHPGGRTVPWSAIVQTAKLRGKTPAQVISDLGLQ